MSDDREDRIRRRAHELWEAAGSPEGRHEDHWIATEEEVGRDPADGGADSGDHPAKELGVSREEPEDAVGPAGSSAKAVRRELAKVHA